MATEKKFDSKWLIPIGMGILVLWSTYRAWVAMHGGSVQQINGVNVETPESDGWFGSFAGWVSPILAVFTIGVVLLMRSEK